jgi:hypothetical protein
VLLTFFINIFEVLPTFFLINIFQKCYQHFFIECCQHFFSSSTFFRSLPTYFLSTFLEMLDNIFLHFLTSSNIFQKMLQQFKEISTFCKKLRHFFRNDDFLTVFHVQLRLPPVLVGALDAGAGPCRGGRRLGRRRANAGGGRPESSSTGARHFGRRPHAWGRDTSAGGARARKPRRPATSRAG